MNDEDDGSTALMARSPFVPLASAKGLDRDAPRPPAAHPISTPRLMDHSHVNANTGVLIRTFKTG